MLLMVSFESKNYDDFIFTENDTESDFADYTVSCICFTCFDIIYFNCDWPIIVIFEYTLLTAFRQLLVYLFPSKVHSNIGVYG